MSEDCRTSKVTPWTLLEKPLKAHIYLHLASTYSQIIDIITISKPPRVHYESRRTRKGSLPPRLD